MAKYSVLIADDDDSQRLVQKLVLKEVAKEMNADIEVDEAVDSIEARKFANGKEYDLIILDNEFKDDLKQGHLPGIAVLQLMRKGGPNISSPIIFCSGDPYNTLGPMAQKFGAVYYPKAKADADEMGRLFSKLLQQ